ncbi:mucin-2-like [Pseudophryne corroboree]|uniref:mucin-2-like n=1 Tax=Pseudophryne corroboree TaxID=495146 RepID=UPI0030813866
MVLQSQSHPGSCEIGIYFPLAGGSETNVTKKPTSTTSATSPTTTINTLTSTSTTLDGTLLSTETSHAATTSISTVANTPEIISTTVVTKGTTGSIIPNNTSLTKPPDTLVTIQPELSNTSNGDDLIANSSIILPTGNNASATSNTSSMRHVPPAFRTTSSVPWTNHTTVPSQESTDSNSTQGNASSLATVTSSVLPVITFTDVTKNSPKPSLPTYTAKVTKKPTSTTSATSPTTTINTLTSTSTTLDGTLLSTETSHAATTSISTVANTPGIISTTVATKGTTGSIIPNNTSPTKPPDTLVTIQPELSNTSNGDDLIANSSIILPTGNNASATDNTSSTRHGPPAFRTTSSVPWANHTTVPSQESTDSNSIQGNASSLATVTSSVLPVITFTDFTKNSPKPSLPTYTDTPVESTRNPKMSTAQLLPENESTASNSTKGPDSNLSSVQTSTSVSTSAINGTTYGAFSTSSPASSTAPTATNLSMLPNLPPLTSATSVQSSSPSPTNTSVISSSPSLTNTTSVISSSPSLNLTTSVKSSSPSLTNTTSVKSSSPSPTNTTSVISSSPSLNLTTSVQSSSPSPTNTTSVKSSSPSLSGTTSIKSSSPSLSGTTSIKSSSLSLSGTTAVKTSSPSTVTSTTNNDKSSSISSSAPNMVTETSVSQTGITDLTTSESSNKPSPAATVTFYVVQMSVTVTGTQGSINGEQAFTLMKNMMDFLLKNSEFALMQITVSDDLGYVMFTVLRKQDHLFNPISELSKAFNTKSSGIASFWHGGENMENRRPMSIQSMI